VGENADQTDQTRFERFTVPEAAQALGISPEAVRTRISRGTLESVRDRGRVFVLLEPDQAQPNTDQTGDSLRSVSHAVISAKDDLIETLREQLAAERQAHAEARRLLAAALDRIPPQIAPPQDGRDPPVTAADDTQRPREVTDPGAAHLTYFLMVASWIGVGTYPLLAEELPRIMGVWVGSPWAKLPLALFVLPFILGLYRGVWNRKRQEFAQQIIDPNDRASYLSDMGLREALVGLITAAGAALVSIGERAGVFGYTPLVYVPADWVLVLWVFIGSFLFFVFALLIGVATGRQQDRHGASRATWQNPQLIWGLVGTIITAAATVAAAFIAAFIGG
jgi:hypothetical protein